MNRAKLRGKLVAAVVVAAVAVALGLQGIALASPPGNLDQTPMVNGQVKGIVQVGDNVWVGGRFTQVQNRNGTVVDNVKGLAVFSAATGEYRQALTPKTLGGATPVVEDMAVYEDGGDVVVAGKFTGPDTKKKNLVRFDGATGAVVRWYNSLALKSVLVHPKPAGPPEMPTPGPRIYAGGVSLTAFELDGKRLWTRAKTSEDDSLRSHNVAPAYRDLELDGDSPTIWAACICDAVYDESALADAPTKALVKLDTEGDLKADWDPYDSLERDDSTSCSGFSSIGCGTFGISLLNANGKLYLGAGGSDYVAQFSKADGKREWKRDTSGSAQVVEEVDGQLVVGGHFWEVADGNFDKCGGGRDYQNGLDPNDQCQTRKGLAAYSFDGTLDTSWDTQLDGKYPLAWALHRDNFDRLHVGGEFTKVGNDQAGWVKQTYYARLSP
jgi:hypothetical protein